MKKNEPDTFDTTLDPAMFSEPPHGGIGTEVTVDSFACGIKVNLVGDETPSLFGKIGRRNPPSRKRDGDGVALGYVGARLRGVFGETMYYLMGGDLTPIDEETVHGDEEVGDMYSTHNPEKFITPTPGRTSSDVQDVVRLAYENLARGIPLGGFSATYGEDGSTPTTETPKDVLDGFQTGTDGFPTVIDGPNGLVDAEE